MCDLLIEFYLNQEKNNKNKFIAIVCIRMIEINRISFSKKIKLVFN